MSDLLDRARAWIAQDPDPVTRAELDAVVAAAEAGGTAAGDDLADRFSGRLEFGTAGLRGALGAGPMRMNRVLVAQAAAGLGLFLRGREAHPSVVIGYDGRHNSRVFAQDSAELLQGMGVAATILPRMLPTPVLAFAVRELRASAGIMVTASHNPPQDNGYKVYLGGADDGSQVVPPADAAIAAQIAAVAAGSIADLPRARDYATAPESIVEEYVRRTAAVAAGAPAASLRVAYTPLHGVGGDTVARVLDAAGFAPPAVVAAQAEPDPDFPTVAFPNPEEPGAMDLLLALAADSGADVAIANDPDADRVAVAIPDAGGTWRALSGNEVGWLLGWQAAERAAATGRRGTLASSLVSSPALGAVAERFGLDHAETLTGFKWISRAPELLFGYEEALGYLVNPDTVRDKDGISAAVAVLALAAELRARGATLADRLDEFAAEFGGFASGQVSIRVSDLAEIERMTAGLRAHPPTAIGRFAVEGVDDFRDGVAGYPPGDIVRYRLAGGGRVIVRPSGTEPKLKCYLDAVSVDGSGPERVAAARAIVAELDAAMRELLR